MLELQELTKIENGKIVGPMVPVQNAENFFQQTTGAPLFKLWRICADLRFRDGGETGTADLLLALIGGRALVTLIDFGAYCQGMALKNNGKPVEVFQHWREEQEFFNPPADSEIAEVMGKIDVLAEIEKIKEAIG